MNRPAGHTNLGNVFVLGTLAFTSISLGQQSNQYVGPTVPPGNLWSVAGNWFQGHSPTSNETALLVDAGSTVMDLLPDSGPAWRIGSFLVGSSSVLSGSELDFGTTQQDRRLLTVGDFARLPNSHTNDFTIRLRGLDAVYVGDPFANPPSAGSTLGLKWDIQGDSPPLGDAEVAVTDLIGCGSWHATTARIGVGYLPTGDTEDWPEI